MRYLSLLLLAACGRPNHAAELAACQLISRSGDELARCLIMKYSWGAESTAAAKAAWQWQLDSIRAEHDAQALAILVEQEKARRVRVGKQNRAFRTCVYQFVKAYNGGGADTAHARSDESYLEATVRTCSTRFPEADPYGPLTQEFIDSLITAGTRSEGIP